MKNKIYLNFFKNLICIIMLFFCFGVMQVNSKNLTVNEDEDLDTELSETLEKFKNPTSQHALCVLNHRDQVIKAMGKGREELNKLYPKYSLKGNDSLDLLRLLTRVPLINCPSNKKENIYFDVQYCYLQIDFFKKTLGLDDLDKKSVFEKECKPYIDKFNKVALPIEKNHLETLLLLNIYANETKG